MNVIEAKKHIKNAWIAAVISGGLTLVLTLISLTGISILGLNLWSLIDVLLIFGLAFGIYKHSRICAVIMLIYFILSKIYIWIESGNIAGFPLAIIFGYFFFQGVRGTFAYHQSEEITKQTKITE